MSPAKRHMGRVAELGCVLCRLIGYGETRAEIHHIGDSSERSDFLVIPLCPEMHRGATGFHGLGEREFNRRYKTSELHLLAETLRLLETRRV